MGSVQEWCGHIHRLRPTGGEELTMAKRRKHGKARGNEDMMVELDDETVRLLMYRAMVGREQIPSGASQFMLERALQKAKSAMGMSESMYREIERLSRETT